MSKFMKEFKEFAFKGNVIDMAVGMLIGSAFTGVVNSVVKDLFTPILAVLTGSVDFTQLGYKFGEAEDAPFLAYGNFIQTVINFFILALCIFMFVKFVNKLRAKNEPAPVPEAPKPAPRKCPYCKSEIADDATRCPHCTSQL